MITWGISALSHDAALAVVKDRQLVFASHSERYSRIKNDKYLNVRLLHEALAYGAPDRICYYEQPLKKLTRQLYARQWNTAGRVLSNYKHELRNHVNDLGLQFGYKINQINIPHHLSHAAAGYYTSKFREATIVVIDAIGEWETLTIWKAEDNKLTKLHSQWYPNSIGLWYSAMTQRLGLKPNEEEYILMGMSAFGDRQKYRQVLKDSFVKSIAKGKVKFKKNLHRGCRDWQENLPVSEYFDVSAGVQQVYEDMLIGVMSHAKNISSSRNLVFMGGCALNCVANSYIANMWDDVWIMPSPGDAGSSIGAILADMNTHIRWPGAYLGHEIQGKYPTNKIIKELLKTKVCGVASGKAEFGPRALGHRSLLADPRGDDIKDLVNKYKHREQFRPFAPMILAEHADTYFEMPVQESPYMQFTATCRQPDKFPAIVHVDNTSRVQTVTKDDCPDVRNLLEKWYAETGCPMLLNTSLNIKGEPLVNSREDAKAFEQKHKIKVYS